ncbi:MAG: sensor histidine kinase [Nitrososphaerota archaeon]
MMKWHRLRMRPLPLRLWLVVAVVAVTGAGFLAQMALVAPVSAWEQQTEDDRISSVRQLIGTDAKRWRDPAWQRNAHAQLAALNVDIALFPAQPNQASTPQQPIFMTAGAHRFLDTESQGASTAPAGQTSAETQLVFQRMVIANPAQPANSLPVGVAFVWDSSSTSGAMLGLLWAFVELGTFGLTLAIVVWLIGQPVIRPLIEMGRAAESIAGGNLNVRLSPSPVHEIAQVSEALEGMTVTLRESLARQESLEKERRLFIGAVAHDLRTPLFMLRGYLQGLQRGVAATPEKAAHYLAMCQAKADELERLIADLFAFTRLEYLEIEPERQPLEMGDLLRQVIEGAQTMAATKDITVTLDAPAPPAPVQLLGDAHLLARAVENLVDNAIRYTPAGGNVSVRWRVEGERLALSVADTGPGIAAHDLAHLFKPLYRGEDSRNRQTGGAGIGLATAKRVFVAHGGSLSAANRPDGGAIFTGTLPMPRRTVLAHAPADSRIDGRSES